MGTDDGMDALEWGWKVDNNQMVQIMTDMKGAPGNLMKMIHNSCQSCSPDYFQYNYIINYVIYCFNNSCRRYGLPCHTGCEPCQTDSCDNPCSDHYRQ